MILTPASLAVSAVCLLLSCALFAAGLFLRRSNAPIHLWPGALRSKNQITDTRRYNRANAIIWFGFGAYLLVCAGVSPVCGFLPALIGAGVLAVSALPLFRLYTRSVFLRFSRPQQDSSGE